MLVTRRKCHWFIIQYPILKELRSFAGEYLNTEINSYNYKILQRKLLVGEDLSVINNIASHIYIKFEALFSASSKLSHLVLSGLDVLWNFKRFIVEKNSLFILN